MPDQLAPLRTKLDLWQKFTEHPRFQELTPDVQQRFKHWYFQRQIVGDPNINGIVRGNPAFAARLQRGFFAKEEAESLEQHARSQMHPVTEFLVDPLLDLGSREMEPGVKREIVRTTESLTSPLNLGLLAGASFVPGAGASLAARLGASATTASRLGIAASGALSGTFAVDMARGLAHTLPELQEAQARFDEEPSELNRDIRNELATRAVLTGLFVFGAGRHAFRSSKMGITGRLPEKDIANLRRLGYTEEHLSRLSLGEQLTALHRKIPAPTEEPAAQIPELTVTEQVSPQPPSKPVTKPAPAPQTAKVRPGSKAKTRVPEDDVEPQSVEPAPATTESRLVESLLSGERSVSSLTTREVSTVLRARQLLEQRTGHRVVLSPKLSSIKEARAAIAEALRRPSEEPPKQVPVPPSRRETSIRDAAKPSPETLDAIREEQAAREAPADTTAILPQGILADLQARIAPMEHLLKELRELPDRDIKAKSLRKTIESAPHVAAELQARRASIRRRLSELREVTNKRPEEVEELTKLREEARGLNADLKGLIEEVRQARVVLRDKPVTSFRKVTYKPKSESGKQTIARRIEEAHAHIRKLLEVEKNEKRRTQLQGLLTQDVVLKRDYAKATTITPPSGLTQLGPEISLNLISTLAGRKIRSYGELVGRKERAELRQLRKADPSAYRKRIIEVSHAFIRKLADKQERELAKLQAEFREARTRVGGVQPTEEPAVHPARAALRDLKSKKRKLSDLSHEEIIGILSEPGIIRQEAGPEVRKLGEVEGRTAEGTIEGRLERTPDKASQIASALEAELHRRAQQTIRPEDPKVQAEPPVHAGSRKAPPKAAAKPPVHETAEPVPATPKPEPPRVQTATPVEEQLQTLAQRLRNGMDLTPAQFDMAVKAAGKRFAGASRKRQVNMLERAVDRIVARNAPKIVAKPEFDLVKGIEDVLRGMRAHVSKGRALDAESVEFLSDQGIQIGGKGPREIVAAINAVLGESPAQDPAFARLRAAGVEEAYLRAAAERNPTDVTEQLKSAYEDFIRQRVQAAELQKFAGRPEVESPETVRAARALLQELEQRGVKGSEIAAINDRVIREAREGGAVHEMPAMREGEERIAERISRIQDLQRRVRARDLEQQMRREGIRSTAEGTRDRAEALEGRELFFSRRASDRWRRLENLRAGEEAQLDLNLQDPTHPIRRGLETEISKPISPERAAADIEGVLKDLDALADRLSQLDLEKLDRLEAEQFDLLEKRRLAAEAERIKIDARIFELEKEILRLLKEEGGEPGSELALPAPRTDIRSRLARVASVAERLLDKYFPFLQLSPERANRYMRARVDPGILNAMETLGINVGGVPVREMHRTGAAGLYTKNLIATAGRHESVRPAVERMIDAGAGTVRGLEGVLLRTPGRINYFFRRLLGETSASFNAAHELGHGIFERLPKKLLVDKLYPQAAREIVGAYRQFFGEDITKDKARYAHEVFAHSFAHWYSGEGSPRARQLFESVLRSNPEVWEAVRKLDPLEGKMKRWVPEPTLDELRQAVENWRTENGDADFSMPLFSRRPQYPVADPKLAEIQRLREVARQTPRLLDRLSSKAFTAIRKFHEKFLFIPGGEGALRFKEFGPGIKLSIQAIEARRGKPLLDKDNPHRMFRLLYGGASFGMSEDVAVRYADVLNRAESQGLLTKLTAVLDTYGYQRAWETVREKHAAAEAAFRQAATDLRGLQRQKGKQKNVPLDLANRITRASRAKRAAKAEMRKFSAKLTKKQVSPLDIDPAYAQAALAREEASLPKAKWQEVMKLANEFWAINREMADILLEDGMISQATFDTWTARGAQYIPLHRLHEATESVQNLYRGGGGSMDLRAMHSIQALEGSSRPNLDPLYDSFDTHLKIIREATRNRAGKVLIGLAELDPDGFGALVRELKTNEAPREGFGVVGYYEAGVPRRFEVPLEIAETVRMAKPIDVAIVGGALFNTFRRVFQIGTTSANLAFMVPNKIRDVLDVMMLSHGATPGGPIGFIRMLTTQFAGDIKDILAHHPDYVEFLRAGGSYGSMQKRAMPENFILNRRLGIKGKLKKGQIINATADINNLVEDSTKFRVYRNLRAKGWSPEEAAWETRNYGGTPDTAASGYNSEMLNQIFMFWNVQEKGITRTFSRLTEDPRRLAYLMFASALSAMIMHSYNSQFTDEDGLPEERHVSRTDKDNYFYLIRPDVYQTSQGAIRHAVVKMPKGHVARLIFNPVSKAVEDAFYGQGFNGTQEALNFLSAVLPGQFNLERGKVMEGIGRGALSSMNPILREPAEQAIGEGGYDAFRGIPIVPRRLADVAPPEKSVPTTSITAKRFAKGVHAVLPELADVPVLGPMVTEPLRVEHAVRGFAGGLGEQALGLADALQGQTTRIEGLELEGDERIARMPGAGYVLRRFVSSTLDEEEKQLSERFYGIADRVRELKATFDLFKRTDPERLQEIVQAPENRVLLSAVSAVTKAQRQLSELRQVQQRIMQDPALSQADKKARIHDLNRARITLLRNFDQHIYPVLAKQIR